MDWLDLLAVQGTLKSLFYFFLNPSTASHIPTMTLSHSSDSLFLLSIQKTKIMASGPITSWEIDGETVETVSDFIFGGSKTLKMVIAAMKLNDAYSLEGKLYPT